MERMNFSYSNSENNDQKENFDPPFNQVPTDEKLESNEAPTAKKGGGWKTMPYIIWNETFEKLASMSLVANLTVYLRSQYNMDGLFSVSVMNVWGGTSNFAPLFGAFISDSYFGRYWTLLGASFCSFLGMGIMTLTAAITTLRPPNCENEGIICQQPEKWQLAVLFTGLGFLAVGAGGIRPCNIAFGVDQFDSSTEKGRNQIENFYNWYYWSFTLALLVALTVVVYIQSNISWAIGLAIPMVFLALSIFVFLLGSHVYIYVKPRGSVYVDLAKITAAAFHKRNLKIDPVCEYTLYDPPINESDPSVSKLKITNLFPCLNKAAVITEHDSFDDQGLPRDRWKLCSVQQVEQFKSILSVLPVWASGICCFIAMDQQSTQGILQAIQTDRRLVNEFQVPPGSLGIVSMLALSIWIPIFEHLVLPLSRCICIDRVGITLKHRLGAGILMSIFCMLVAGIVEGKRRDLALSNHSFEAPMTFAWLLPQFVLSGMTEAFSGIGMMEFLGRKFPSSMRTLAASTFFLSLAIASYLSSFLINLVYHATKTDESPGWLGGRDLNINRLDYYYYFVAGLCVLNLIYYATYASWYVDSDNVQGQNSNESDLNKISD